VNFDGETNYDECGFRDLPQSLQEIALNYVKIPFQFIIRHHPVTPC
jgi:hypothetical protein